MELYDDGIGVVEYVAHMGTDLTIVNSARVSFGKNKEELDEKDKKLISYLIKHKHTSTFEHNVITFRFTVPLFVRSQHHRHRTCSYNEISRRYTSADIRFYEPQSYRSQHYSNRQASNLDKVNPKIPDHEFRYYLGSSMTRTTVNAVKDHHITALRLFEDMLEAGVCREQARGILPQNMYTQYYGTVNLNNLLKFIDLRTHEGAQWEIQRVAEACREIALQFWPEAMEAYSRIRHTPVT